MPYGIEVKNKADGVGEIFIHGEISDEKWYDTDVTPKELRVEMDKIKNARQVNLYVNSIGGGVFAGMAIYSMIKRLTVPVTAYVDGIAASIASVIIMAAQKIVVPKNGLIMIHNPSAGAMGDANDLRKTADVLDKVKETLVAVYSARTGSSEKEIRAMMDDETWMTGEEAAVFGFADEVGEEMKVAAKFDGRKGIINGIALDFTKYDRAPVDQLPKQEEPAPEPIDYSRFENEILFNNTLIQEVSYELAP